LRGRISIAEVLDEPPDALRVTYRTTVEIDGASRPACVADTIALHRR
jgi:hypothetical protein